jgi:hypothetical protein
VKTKNLFQGSWQKVLIRVIVLLLVLYIVYRIFSALYTKLFKYKTSEEYLKHLEEIKNQIPNDNSTLIDPDTITDSEAGIIADQLQFNMDGFGTQEDEMFNALQCLNGASLKKIYNEFGQRDYDGQMMGLFGWFSQELSNSIFSSGVFWDDCVPECDGYWDNCYALTYMREIWKKSGIQITF